MLKKRIIFTLLYIDGFFYQSRNFNLQKVGDVQWLKKNYNFQNISFFIGPTTGVIVALEKDLRVVHICFDPIFDSYSSEMWPNLKTIKIGNNSLEYTLIKKNSFIKFGNDKNLFKNHFIDIK